MIVDNPSIGNYEELGDLYLDDGQFVKARECFDKVLAREESIDHGQLRRPPGRQQRGERHRADAERRRQQDRADLEADRRLGDDQLRADRGGRRDGR